MSKSTAVTSSNQQKNQPTVVSLYDVDDLTAHHCGYCNQDGNISVGMSSELMQIQDYQLLIDRGWRRSGTYIYKPIMNKTCCPLYTIRHDALNIKLRKSQKNVLKSMKKYLETKKDEKPVETTRKAAASTNSDLTKPLNKPSSDSTVAQRIKKFVLENNITDNRLPPHELLNLPKLKSKHKRLFKKLANLKQKQLIHNYSDIEKCLKRNTELHTSDRSLETLLKYDESKSNKLEVTLLRSWPPSKQFHESLQEVHDVYVKYQTRIHGDSPIECNLKQFQRFLCTSPLMPLSYNGPLTSTETVAVDETRDLKNIGYGSFHQQYRLNGQLIAVGVIDILNYCVSSVYFFYDPSYQSLNLGTYSALREIELVRKLNKIDANIKWYYLGFYAHSCKKMRYKGQFIPSYLSCPEAFTWHPIEKCSVLLEKSKYSRFDEDNSNEPDEVNIEHVKIRVKFRDSEMKIFQLEEFCDYLNESYIPHFRKLVHGYSKLFGKQFSDRVLIKF